MSIRYIKLSLLILLCAGIGIVSYYILKDIKVKREMNQLKDTLQNSPEKIESKHQLGLLYMYQGDYKRAEEEFLGILSMDPYNRRALTSIGMMYYKKGEPHHALTYWRSLLEVEPDNKFIWSLVNKISKGKEDGTVSHGDVRVVNDEWERYYTQGQGSYQKKDYKNAVENFKKAIELNPNDFRTYFNIAASYYEMKDLKEAIKNWQTALKYKKDDLMTMKLITLAEQGMDRRGEVEAVKIKLMKEPSNWELHAMLAEAYLKDKDTVKDAEREYLEVLRLNPSNSKIYDRLIDLSVKLNEYDKAIDFAKKSINAVGEDNPIAKRRLNSLLEYKKLAEKGRESWTIKGMNRYKEMIQVSENKEILFYIDKYEVTNAQYKEFIKSTGHTPPLLWGESEILGKENYPVVRVSWYDAVMYCKWAGKRLPTEEEWIKAGWGENRLNYPWGDKFDHDFANTSESGFNNPSPAGVYNHYNGVYDMVGNVMEWTFSEKVNPSDGKTYKIKKGGAFTTDPQAILSFTQWAALPTQWDDATGFRCAKSVR